MVSQTLFQVANGALRRAGAGAEMAEGIEVAGDLPARVPPLGSESLGSESMGSELVPFR
jgi:hypothetical protein